MQFAMYLPHQVTVSSASSLASIVEVPPLALSSSMMWRSVLISLLSLFLSASEFGWVDGNEGDFFAVGFEGRERGVFALPAGGLSRRNGRAAGEGHWV